MVGGWAKRRSRSQFKGQTTAVDLYDLFAHRIGPCPRVAVDRLTPGRLLPANATIQMLAISGGAERVKTLGDMLRRFAIADAPPTSFDELQARGDDKAVVDTVWSSV